MLFTTADGRIALEFLQAYILASMYPRSCQKHVSFQSNQNSDNSHRSGDLLYGNDRIQWTPLVNINYPYQIEPAVQHNSPDNR
jgi:hypothetical protein